MKRLPVCVVVGLLSLTLTPAAQTASDSTTSPVPLMIQFSNVATDESGNLLSGEVSITFSFYNSQQGGEPLWTETQANVQLDPTGHYSVQLGITTPKGLPTTLFTSGRARWLAVRIAGQAEQPRVLLLSVPYALKAGDAATIGGLPPSAFVLAATGSTLSTSAPTGSDHRTVQDALQLMPPDPQPSLLVTNSDLSTSYPMITESGLGLTGKGWPADTPYFGSSTGLSEGSGFFFSNPGVFWYTTGTAAYEITNQTNGGFLIASSIPMGFSSGTPDIDFQDIELSRVGAHLLGIGVSHTVGDTTGFVKTGQSVQVTSADVTCGAGGTISPCTSFETITGLSLTLPPVSATWSFSCDLVVSQATATSTVEIGIQTSSHGATNMTAYGVVVGTTTTGTITDVPSTTTAQSVLTFTPVATATLHPIHLSGALEGVSTSGTMLNVVALNKSNANLLTIYRGSSCWIY
jgi:hypothetical protein